jgi:SAM-dependent methyltransferase
MAEAGADVHGIDISLAAVEHCRTEAERRGLGIEFSQMNAHHTQFPDESFDIISGLGVLHHLELPRAYAELVRLLKPGGRAVFREGLGGNPLINWYRRRTPQLRSADEQPLSMRDILLAREYFDRVDLRFHHFWTLTAVPFRSWPGFGALLAWCRFWDNAMFARLPLMRRLAWMVTMVLREPRKR